MTPLPANASTPRSYVAVSYPYWHGDATHKRGSQGPSEPTDHKQPLHQSWR